MSGKQRCKVICGLSQPPKELIASVIEAEGKRLVPKKKAPVLHVPAGRTVWLKEGTNSYRFEMSNAMGMAQRGIRVDPNMLIDHFPSRYEHAFDQLVLDTCEVG